MVIAIQHRPGTVCNPIGLAERQSVESSSRNSTIQYANSGSPARTRRVRVERISYIDGGD